MDIKKLELKFESNGKTIKVGKGESFRLLNVEGIDSADFDLSIQGNVLHDGGSVVGRRLGSRPIMIECEYQGADKAIERTKTAGFFNVHRDGNLTINYMGVERIIYYVANNYKAPLENVNNPYKFLVDIICPNPYWQTVNPFRNDMAVFVGMFEFPLEIPINEGITFGEQGEKITIENKGDAETPVKIEFNGPAENPRVTNETTGEYILVDRVIGAEQKLVINTDIEVTSVEIHSENGDVENVFHWIDLSSTFWQLQVGENEIKYEADIGMDTALVKIEHHERYIGI